MINHIKPYQEILVNKTNEVLSLAEVVVIGVAIGKSSPPQNQIVLACRMSKCVCQNVSVRNKSS